MSGPKTAEELLALPEAPAGTEIVAMPLEVGLVLAVQTEDGAMVYATKHNWEWKRITVP